MIKKIAKQLKRSDPAGRPNQYHQSLHPFHPSIQESLVDIGLSLLWLSAQKRHVDYKQGKIAFISLADEFQKTEEISYLFLSFFLLSFGVVILFIFPTAYQALVKS